MIENNGAPGRIRTPDPQIRSLGFSLSPSVIAVPRVTVSNILLSARFRYVLVVSSRRRYYVVTRVGREAPRWPGAGVREEAAWLRDVSQSAL